jgi:hypothetical protein
LVLVIAFLIAKSCILVLPNTKRIEQIKSVLVIVKCKMRIPDYSDSISGSIRTIKPDTSGHLVMYFDFT